MITRLARTLVPPLLGGVLLVAGCGGDPPLVHSVRAAAPAEGAPSAADVGGVAKAGVTPELGAALDRRAPASSSTTAAGGAEARVLRGTSDLLAGFFGALELGDFTRAASYTAGPASLFLQTITRTGACGLTVVKASTSPPTQATVGAKGEFRLDARSSLTFSTGVTQRFDEVSVREERNGSWRVYDLLLGGASVETYLTAPLPVELEFDRLRMLRVDACYSPTRIAGSVDLVSGSDFRTEFVDAFVRLPNGTVLRQPAALDALREPIAPHGRRRWTFDFVTEQAGTIATIVLVTVDTEGKSLGLPRERLYPVKMAPLFAAPVTR